MFVESLNFRCHLPARAQTGPVTAGMPSLKGEAVCLSVLLVTTPTLHGDSAPETGLLVTAAGSLGPGRREGGPGGQGWGPRPQGRVLGPWEVSLPALAEWNDAFGRSPSAPVRPWRRPVPSGR